MINPKHAIVVLSGGQDSVTCLFWAIHKFEKIHAVTFDYGQRHAIEIEAAIKTFDMAKQTRPDVVVSHEVITLPNCLESTSPLTTSNDLEQYTSAEQMAETIGNRVELTFVPMRNTLFFTVAANRAIARGCGSIVTGICQEDNANYPDCTEDFRWKLQAALNTSLGVKFFETDILRIEAPLIHHSKAETVCMAKYLEGCWEALAHSHTSYDGKYPPTDMNHSNVLRAEGFLQAGLPDPLVVRAYREGLMALPPTPNYNEVIL
jgi:7-cyano-7-deazaguanine synthase